MHTDNVVLIEFNELSPPLLQQLMADGELPNFRRFYEQSAVFTTDADASQPNLEPWIQWPTVHLGVSHREHGIRHLGDVDDTHRPLGELLSAAGHRVGICGSMNIRHREVNGFAIPDPWNTDAPSLPRRLEPFHRTVSTMVQESSRDDADTNPDLLGFVRFMARNGLRPQTVASVLRQLAAEKRDPGVRWRRASILDLLQYDLFRTSTRRACVRFATFFSNSTAHYQHYYWRHMDPARFHAPPDESEHQSLRDAIHYGYRAMDWMLKQFMKDFPDATLALCTALSQEPWTDSTKVTYRPGDFAALLDVAGIPRDSVTVQPIMAEEFVLRFASEAEAEKAAVQLDELSAGPDQRLLGFVNEGSYLVGGCAINQTVSPDLPICRNGQDLGHRFGDLFYSIHTVRSGRHNPEGALWIRTGQHRVAADPVPLTDIAPTVLSLLETTQPSYMSGNALL